MCGIVATLGKKQALPFLLDGLQNLEYRGYDSAGIVTLHKNEINLNKAVGQVKNLVEKLNNRPSKATIGIGHTRWATHGQVLLKNTHPHSDENQEFFVAHNGIIENYQPLKKFLIKKGYKFSSDTDTEVIPQLLAYNFKKTKNVRQAILNTLQVLKGAYALVILAKNYPEKLWGAKLSGPLILGITDEQFYLASDPLALGGYTEEMIVLKDYELAEITPFKYTITDLKNKKIIQRKSEILEISTQQSQLKNHPNFMHQEIFATPQTIENVIRGRLNLNQKIIKLGGLDLVRHQLQHIDRLLIIGCGSSYFAGLVGEYLFEEISQIPTEVQLASEFRYRNEPLSRSTAMISISQSGETADTIAALQKVEQTGILKLGIVNVVGSTISRITDAGVFCQAGVEKSVAATKSFIAQVTVLTLMSLYFSRNYKDYNVILKSLAQLPQQIDEFLKNNNIKAIAKKYAKQSNFLFLGRRYNYPIALEGALKLKEISYIHAEGIAAGEIKHGSLALIDKNCPTFAIALQNSIYDKVVNNLQEIKARNGPIIAIVDSLKKPATTLADDTILIPKLPEPLQPIFAAIVSHLFAYEIANILKRPIDKPRNLAKSVTVE